MTTRTQSGLVAATIFIFSLFGAGSAQGQRAARASGGTSAAHAQPVSARVGTVHGTAGNRTAPVTRSSLRFNAASNTFVSGDGTVLSPQDLLNTFSGSSSGYPGFAANNPNLGIEALIDPVTQWRLAIAERVLRATPRFFGSGYYLLDGGGAYAVPAASSDSDQPAQQPQVIVVQGTPSTQQTASQETGDSAAPPLPDVGQFTLVLQNGTQIQAVAFSRMNDRIIYITADGSRRTLALSDLNTDATVQINQERGTPLQFPL
jgi:hypothetical protein